MGERSRSRIKATLVASSTGLRMRQGHWLFVLFVSLIARCGEQKTDQWQGGETQVT